MIGFNKFERFHQNICASQEVDVISIFDKGCFMMIGTTVRVYCGSKTPSEARLKA